MYRVSVLRLTQSAKSLLVQGPKWLPDASSILLWLKSRHIHTHTQFAFYSCISSLLTHTAVCVFLLIATYRSIFPHTDWPWLINSFTNQWNILPVQQYRHTQSWNVFVKLQHLQLLLWKAISSYCSNAIVGGLEAEQSQ